MPWQHGSRSRKYTTGGTVGTFSGAVYSTAATSTGCSGGACVAPPEMRPSYSCRQSPTTRLPEASYITSGSAHLNKNFIRVAYFYQTGTASVTHSTSFIIKIINGYVKRISFYMIVACLKCVAVFNCVVPFNTYFMSPLCFVMH